jgi:hypothetical protein
MESALGLHQKLPGIAPDGGLNRRDTNRCGKASRRSLTMV